MYKKSITIYTISIITITFCISCKLQNNGSNQIINDIPMEQEIINYPEKSRKGYFSVEDSLINKIQINFYSSLIDKKPEVEKTVSDLKVIKDLVKILSKLPEKGDIFRKLASTSSRYHIKFFAGQSIAGEANIYNNSLQMSNTAFLAEENEHETLFVKKVKELTGQNN